MNDLQLSELAQKADPYVEVHPSVGAAALARAERSTARVWPRRFAVAVALVLSSAVLAAVARRITAAEGGTAAGAARVGAGHAPVAAPRIEAPAPVAVPVEAEVKPAPKRAAAQQLRVQPKSTLGEEAELLLKALTQL